MMDKISEHISYLLTNHECVVIPDFGAFIISENSAKLAGGSNSVILAPYKSVGFNHDLKTSDGLLADSLARVSGISYSQALFQIKNWVDELMHTLNSGNSFHIPGVGYLNATDGRILFTPSSHPIFNISNYGLYNFTFDSLSLSETKKRDKGMADKATQTNGKRDVLYIPVNWKLLRGVGAVAATVVSFILLSTPIDNNSTPSQYAGVVSSLYERNFTSKESSQNVEKRITESADKRPDLQKKKFAGRYHLVVATFYSKKTAEKACGEIGAKGLFVPKILFVQGSQKYRIAVKDFEDVLSANTYLNSFVKKYPKFKDAWIVKSGS